MTKIFQSLVNNYISSGYQYSFSKQDKEGKFVSENVINLSRKNLSRSEISMLSKGLKFVPSTNKTNREKLKR